MLHVLFLHFPNFSKQHKTHTQVYTSEQCFLTIRDLNQNNGKTTVFGDMTARRAWKKTNNPNDTLCMSLFHKLNILHNMPLSLKKFHNYRPPVIINRARAMSQFHLIHPINFVNNKCKRRKTNTWPGMLLLIFFFWSYSFCTLLNWLVLLFFPSFFCFVFHIYCVDIFGQNKYRYLWKSHCDQGHLMVYSTSLLLL